MGLVKTVLFAGSFVLAGLAVWDKLAELLGYKLLLTGRYEPSRLLELAAIALLFVIALQLRQIGASLAAKS
jgi:hypothetical protein